MKWPIVDGSLINTWAPSSTGPITLKDHNNEDVIYHHNQALMIIELPNISSQLKCIIDYWSKDTVSCHIKDWRAKRLYAFELEKELKDLFNIDFDSLCKSQTFVP